MGKRKGLIVKVGFVITLLFAIILSSLPIINGSVFALTPGQAEPSDAIANINKKILTNNVYECIKKPEIRQSLDTINELSKLNALSFEGVTISKKLKEAKVIAPVLFGSTQISNGEVSCKDVFFKNKKVKMDSVEEVNASSLAPTTADGQADMMKALGYNYTLDTSEVSHQGCFYIQYKTKEWFQSDLVGRTNEICLSLDDSNNLVTGYGQIENKGGQTWFSEFDLAVKSCVAFGLGCKTELKKNVQGVLKILVQDYSLDLNISYYGGYTMENYDPLWDSTSDSLGQASIPLYDGNGGTSTWSSIKSGLSTWANKLNDYALGMLTGGHLEQCPPKDGYDHFIYLNDGSYCPSSGDWFNNVSVIYTKEPGVNDGGAGHKKWFIQSIPGEGPVYNPTYFTGMSLYDAIYTDDDKYTMLYTYINSSSVYGIAYYTDASLPQCQHTSPVANNESIPVRVKSTGDIVYCELSGALPSDSNLAGRSGTSNGRVMGIKTLGHSQLVSMDIHEVLNELNTGINFANVSDDHIVLIDDCSANPDAEGCTAGGGGVTPNPTEPDPGEEITEKTDECYANAGALGWIMCPVIKALSSVMDWAYQTIEEHFLLVEVAQSFSIGSATYNAWNIIRNIANVAFAILLLVVIFSQVTGFGIDNYGIKRILPRLIIAVILINLSFIVCQLLIDISNIVGVSLKNMLEGLIPQIGGPGPGANPLAVFGGATVDLALAAAIIYGVAMFSSSGGIGIVLALLLGLLAVVIAILFLFIILITRHAALIMLVIISPLALVCYMLPNTEKLFKRWADAGKGLLLLYPICSIVVGGGKFAGAILSNLGHPSNADPIWIYNFAAMLIQVAPYFLIPSLLRGSLKGIGNIGEKINGLGRNLSRTARGSLDRAARNSNLMKDAQERQLDRKIMRGANARLRRVAERESGIRGYLPGGRKRDKNGNYIIDEKRLANQSVARKKQIANAAATVAGNNEKVVNAQASMATKNLSESAIDARAKGFEEAEVEKAIKDQEALIKATDDFKANNYAELEKQYLAAAKDGNVNKARAYHNLMMGTDAGRKALMNGFSQVLRSSDVTAATKNAIRNDLRGDKHSAVLKNTVRSMFNEVTSNRDTSALKASVFDTSGSTLDTSSVNVNNYAPETLAGADDSEIAKLQQYVAQNANSTDADVQANVRRIAQLVQETSEAGHAGRLKVKEGNQAIFDKITATASAAGGTSGFDPQWRDKVTVKINGSDYQVYKVPDGFGSAKISIDGSGHVIYRNAQGNKFDATNNTIKP